MKTYFSAPLNGKQRNTFVVLRGICERNYEGALLKCFIFLLHKIKY